MNGGKDPAQSFENATAAPAAPKPVKGAAIQCSAPPPPPNHPNLIAVELPDSSVLAAKGMQFVNFPGDDKWNDSAKGPKNKNRQTQTPPVLVRFDRPCSESFKIKVVPGGSNSVYSGIEEGRDANFTHEKTEKTNSTKPDGTQIVTGLQIAAAGKDVYKYTAQDNYGNTATSVEIETIRRLYIQELKMPGISAASSLSTFIGEYAKHGIELVQLPAGTMTHVENVDANQDTSTFQTEARKGYVASGCSAREPYVVALAYTDHLAVKGWLQTTMRDIQVARGKPPLSIPLVLDGETKYLWKGIVTGEGWFISASFLRNGATQAVNIPASLVTAVSGGGPADRCSSVSIDLSALTNLVKAPAVRKLAAKASPFTGSITVKVYMVQSMCAGLSFGGGNLICACTRAWWAPISESDQNQVMVHELGHTIGMVPDGTTLDRTANQYIGKGHVGSHCHTGLAVLASYDGVRGSGCVMFGMANGLSAFCADCAKAVKKVDLSAGWSAF